MIRRGEKILFIGDSITDAFRRPDEPNNAFQLGNGYAFLIAARLGFERAVDELTFCNRGVSGDGLAKLQARWNTDCLQLAPSLVSILVGVNETISRFSQQPFLPIDEFEKRYHALLEGTRAVLPTTQIVVVEPFLLPCGMVVSAAWRDDMSARQNAARRAARENGATWVPLQDAFDAACESAPPAFWAYDGVHATAAGFELIARRWLEIVDSGCV